uniref:NLE domain-containing protein n=1 Tax=Meloidogyne floridensis TaxID=298350 RepID=A0A915P1Z6_9BILA
MQESSIPLDTSHIQIKFFTKDERFSDQLPKQIFNVPISSESEQLNILINKVGETNDNWKQLKFDFLIDSILLRVSLFDFIDTYKLSLENIIELECIEQSPAPVPQLDLTDSEWVADVKIINEKCIVSVNYGGEFILWNITKNKTETIAERNVVKKLDEEPIKCLDAFSHGNNGTRAISGSFDKFVKVWNISEDNSIDSNNDEETSPSSRSSKRPKIDQVVNTKTPMVTLQAHKEAVVDIKWNPLNSGQAVSVSWDQQILVWDLEMAGPITNLPSNRAFSALSLNPKNGIALTASTDSFIRMWDLKSKEGSLVKNTYCGHLAWVSDVCWSPLNEYLFCSSSFDGTVKMWDTRSPKAALYDLMGHQDRVLCVDWSSSERIASGSVDCSVKVFSC